MSFNRSFPHKGDLIRYKHNPNLDPPHYAKWHNQIFVMPKSYPAPADFAIQINLDNGDRDFLVITRWSSFEIVFEC